MTYIPDGDFEKDLAEDEEVQKFLAEVAGEALVASQSVARSIGGTGDYETSLETDGPRLLTTDEAGHIIEYGSSDTPPHAPLRRGVEMIGLTFKDDR